MMKYIRLLEMLTAEPLAMSPAKLTTIMEVLRVSNFSGFHIEPKNYIDIGGRGAESIATENHNNIAKINIHGSLAHRNIDAGSGVISYEGIGNAIAEAVDDPNIDGIFLDISSHGGQAEGMPETAAIIREANEIKPVHAIARGAAYSAGYGLLSAAGRVSVIPSGGVGSVGVMMLHADRSEAAEKSGIKYTAIFSGTHKNDLSPHGELTQSVIDAMQERVDEMRVDFSKMVAGYRGLSVEAILNTEANIYTAKQAVKTGLVDAVNTYQEAFFALDNAISKRNSAGGAQMNTRQRFSALIENNADAQEALEGLGYIPVDAGAVEAKVKAALEKQAAEFEQKNKDMKEEANRFNDSLLAACELGGVSVAMARKYLASGDSVAAVTASILSEKEELEQSTDGAVHQSVGIHPHLAKKMKEVNHG